MVSADVYTSFLWAGPNGSMSGANVGRVTSFADNVGVNELTDLCLIEILVYICMT